MEEKIRKLIEEKEKVASRWTAAYKAMMRSAKKCHALDVAVGRLCRRLKKARRELREQKKWQPLGPMNGKGE